MEFRDTLPMVLNRALDRVLPPFREIFIQHDLTETQWRVLRILWENDKATSAKLAQDALVPPPSLVGVLDRLEKRELVTRTRSSEDRRIVFVKSTDQGKELARRVLPLVEDINTRLEASVSDLEWRQMVTTLEKIRAVQDDAVSAVKSA